MNKKYKISMFNTYVPVDNNHELVYNSLTQAFSLLDDKDIQLLNIYRKPDSNHTAEKSSLLNHFLMNGFLVPLDIDELALFQKQYQMERMRPDHMGITILPTLDCNFGCSYCFEGVNKKQEYMPQEIEQAVIRLIRKKAPSIKSLNITWFGGEPLLGLNSIKRLSNKIIPFCDMNHISYYASVITNGYLLDEKNVAELYLRKVRTIQITLDGSKNVHDSIRYIKNTEHGSFDNIINNIKNYSKKFQINTIIRINIDKNNIHSIYSLLDELAENGLGNNPLLSVYFAPIEASTTACGKIASETFDMENFAKLEFDLFRYAVQLGLCRASLPYHLVSICNAARVNGLVILPNGTLHRCWETVTQSDKSIGNLGNGDSLTKNNLEEQWNQFSPLNDIHCRECPILPSCAGYCAYRFLYASEYAGNRKVPCPALKYNISDKLLHFASLQDQNIARLLFEKENRT